MLTVVDTIANITKRLNEKDTSLKSLEIDSNWFEKLGSLKEMDEKSFSEFTNAVAKSEKLTHVLVPLPLLFRIGNKRFITFLETLAKIAKRKKLEFTFTLHFGGYFSEDFDVAKVELNVFSAIVNLMKQGGPSAKFMYNLDNLLIDLDDDRFKSLIDTFPYLDHAPISFETTLNKLSEERIRTIFNLIVNDNNFYINIISSSLRNLSDEYFSLFIDTVSRSTKPTILHHPSNKLATERFNRLCNSIQFFDHLGILDDVKSYDMNCFKKMMSLLISNRIGSLYIDMSSDFEKPTANNENIAEFCKALEKNCSISYLVFYISGKKLIKENIIAMINAIANNKSISRLNQSLTFITPDLKEYFMKFCDVIAAKTSLFSFKLWPENFYLSQLDEDCFAALKNAIQQNATITELPGLSLNPPEYISNLELARQRLKIVQDIINPRITLSTHALIRCLKKRQIKSPLGKELPQVAIEKILSFYTDQKKLQTQVMAREFPEKTPKVPIIEDKDKDEVKDGSIVSRKFR